MTKQNPPPHRLDGKASPMFKGVPMYRYNGSQWVDGYLSDRLVCYLDMQSHSTDLDGGTVFDRSGSGNNATIIAGTQIGDGRVGEALEMRGNNNSELHIPDDSSLPDGGSSFTISTWVRARSPPKDQATLLWKTSDTPSYGNVSMGLRLVKDAGYIQGSGDFGVDLYYFDSDGNNRSVNKSGVFSLGPWYHIVGTFDSSSNTLTLYINNREVDQASFPSPPIDNSEPIIIGPKYKTDGSGDVMDYLDGDIASWRLYDRVLSDNERTKLYDLGGPVHDTFYLELQGEPFPAQGVTDPMPVYEAGRSPPYLLSVTEDDQNDLYESTDLSNWTQIAADITTDTANQNHVRVDGTYYVYDQYNQVWSGLTLDSLTLLSSLDAFEGNDVGAFHEDGTFYVYSEDAPVPDDPSGNEIGLYTSADAAGPYEYQGAVIDLSDRPEHTGDPDIEKIDGTYYMFVDWTISHDKYGTTLAKADNPAGPWTIVDDGVKNSLGGDIELMYDGEKDRYVAFSEFTGGDRAGVGWWTVEKVIR